MSLPRLRTVRLILPMLLSGLIAFGGTAFAQEAQTASEIPYKELEGPTSFTGLPVIIGADYGARYQVDLPPSNLLLIVPKSDGIRTTPGGKVSGEPGLILFDFADETLTHLAERLRLYSLAIPETASNQKGAWAATALKDTLVPFVTKDYVDIEQFDFYRTKIGEADAVSAHLGMRDPQTNEYRFFWLTVLLDPRTVSGVFAVHMADRTASPVKSPDDIGLKGNAVPVLRSLTFTVRP